MGSVSNSTLFTHSMGRTHKGMVGKYFLFNCVLFVLLLLLF